MNAGNPRRACPPSDERFLYRQGGPADTPPGLYTRPGPGRRAIVVGTVTASRSIPSGLECEITLRDTAEGRETAAEALAGYLPALDFGCCQSLETRARSGLEPRLLRLQLGTIADPPATTAGCSRSTGCGCPGPMPRSSMPSGYGRSSRKLSKDPEELLIELGEGPSWRGQRGVVIAG